MKRIITAALIQVIVITLCVGNTQAVDVVVIDKIGSKTAVTGLLLRKVDKCGEGMYYLGVPRETTLDLQYLPLNTGDYILKVPFSLIQQFSVTTKPGKYEGVVTYEFTVTLTNKTILRGRDYYSGKIWNDLEQIAQWNALKESDVFIGKTELGSFRIPVTEVREITFSEPNHPVAVNHPASSTKATLRLADKTEIALHSVSFVINEKNENGCRVREKSVNMFKFKTEGGLEYELSLDKISAFTFSAGAPTFAFTLTSKQGQKYVGHSLDAIGIAATTEIGGVTLEVIVPFTTQAVEINF